MSFTSWVRGKSKAYIFGLASFAALAGVAGGMFVQGPSVIAGVCDRTNIIRCGLNGSSHASYIQSFQHFYTTNHDPGGGYNDLQGIFNWAGFNSSLVAGMNTTNTKIGYVYRNGEVKVNGERVGAGAQVTTRYAGKGRPQIMPGVYVRSAAENKHNPESILVLFDQKGQAIAGVMTRCGNAIKITPVKRSLTCDSLKAVPTHKPREYQLTATATPTNMNIESYVFSYGDGQQSTVNTAARSAKTLHTYPADNTKYTAKVTVKAKNSFGVTSATCQTTLTTPRPAVSIDKKVSGSELVPVGQNYNYQIAVKNTGNVVLKDAVVTDTPASGSNIQLVSANGVGDINGNTWTYTIPSLNVGETKTFTLTAKVTAYKAGNLVNTACVNAKEVNPGNPTKQDDCDDAVVKVPAPVYSCDSLTLQKGANRTVTATVAYTAENGATYKNTTLVWGDSKQTVIDGKTSTHTYAAYGTYTVNAEMLFNVNGSVKAPAPNAACVKQVTFEAPKTPSVKIDKKVEGKESLKVEIDKPYTYNLKVTNDGEVDLKDVVVTDTPASGSNIQLVSANGVGDINGNTWTYTIPSLNVGETKTFTLTAKVTAYKAGNLVNTACVNAKEVNPGNPTKQDDCDDAVVGVDEPVVPTPVYSCDALNLTAGANRTVTAKVMYTAKNGASFETATFHWGDGSASDPSAQTSADHVYAADGSYTVTAKLVFDVNGEKKTVGGDNCVKTVNFVAPEEPVVPTPEETEPQVLPDTGAGSIIGLSGVIGVLSALGYRLFLGRKLARD